MEVGSEGGEWRWGVKVGSGGVWSGGGSEGGEWRCVEWRWGVEVGSGGV